jgi:hypothetical protein
MQLAQFGEAPVAHSRYHPVIELSRSTPSPEKCEEATGLGLRRIGGRRPANVVFAGRPLGAWGILAKPTHPAKKRKKRLDKGAGPLYIGWK